MKSIVNSPVYCFLKSALMASERNQIRRILMKSTNHQLLRDDAFIKAKGPRQFGHTSSMVELIRKFCVGRRAMVVNLNRDVQERYPRIFTNGYKIDFETIYSLNRKMPNIRADYQFIFFDMASLVDVKTEPYDREIFMEFISRCAFNRWNNKEPFFYVEIE